MLPGLHLKQRTQIGPGRDFPKLEQSNFAEHIVVDEYPAERRLPAFDLRTHQRADKVEVQPHNAELHDRAVRLPTQ